MAGAVCPPAVPSSPPSIPCVGPGLIVVYYWRRYADSRERGHVALVPDRPSRWEQESFASRHCRTRTAPRPLPHSCANCFPARALEHARHLESGARPARPADGAPPQSEQNRTATSACLAVPGIGSLPIAKEFFWAESRGQTNRHQRLLVSVLFCITSESQSHHRAAPMTS